MAGRTKWKNPPPRGAASERPRTRRVTNDDVPKCDNHPDRLRVLETPDDNGEIRRFCLDCAARLREARELF